MNSEIVYWLDALNGIMKSPDLHFGVLVKNSHSRGGPEWKGLQCQMTHRRHITILSDGGDANEYAVL